MNTALDANKVSGREARSGRVDFDAIVFVHGFLDSRSVWDPLINGLSGTGIPSVAIDLRGAGERRADDDRCTLAQAVADIEALFDASGLSRVALVGHSMGAQIAELVAMERPGSVAALVLITPAPLRGNALPDDIRMLLRESGADPVAQRHIRAMFSKNLPEAQLDALVAPDALMGKRAVRQYYDAFSVGDRRGDAPCRYTGPTLIIGAQDDPVIPPEQVAATHRERFPEAALRLIANSGHWPHLEQPAITTGVIAAHLGVRQPLAAPA
ncbi:alpha/beta fold hydrolase [Burkholderia sp. MR1-5-21]